MNKKSAIKLFVIFPSMLALAFVSGFAFFHFFYPRDYVQIPLIKSSQFVKQTISSHSLIPVISNQWYSNVFTSFPTQPLYALPLVYRITPSGIGFSYPPVVKKENSITAEYSEDFTLGFENSLNKPKVTSVGDWNITLTAKTDDNNSLSFVLGHGLPFTVIHTTGNKIILSFPNSYKVFDQNQTELNSINVSVDAVRILTNGNNYILVFPQKTFLSMERNTITIANPQRIFAGLLDKTEHFSDFQKTANVEISDTQAAPAISDNKLITDYQISTNGVIPLIALYPHQYDYLSGKKDALGSYSSIRGNLTLIKANEFTTSIPLIIPPGSFPRLTHDYPDLIPQIKDDIKSVIQKGPPKSADYYLGTWFGKIDNLLLLADSYGLDKEKNQLQQYAEPLFVQSLSNFAYDKEKTSVIAKSPEFGNENLNDHHFHYGYFIRTAAVLSGLDLTFLPKISEKIFPMVSDVATLERDDNSYPFIRNMDIYEGHSWADGNADFADGNNQESSSEAINCWYALYLWSKVTNDKNLENYSLYLYNTEITGALYYWFDANSKIYSASYKHPIASIVWGGKVDFATWFSSDTNMKYGIELLPFTPASGYLGTLGNFSRYESDFTGSGGDIVKPWGDLFAMWKSFYAPEEVVKIKNQINSFETDNPKSLFLYTLYANLENSPSPTISNSPVSP